MYINIKSAADILAFFDKERLTNDTVFNKIDPTMYPRYQNIHEPYASDDKDYTAPDRAQYIFSTMGKGINVMYSNNMVTPIRAKPTLNGFNMVSSIGRYIKTKSIDNGIYIVDYYNIYNNSSTEIKQIIDYYLYNADNICYSKDVIDNIQDIMLKREDRNLPTEYKLRIITYLSQETINENGYVYVPTSDLVIAKESISNRIVHPVSSHHMC